MQKISCAVVALAVALGCGGGPDAFQIVIPPPPPPPPPPPVVDNAVAAITVTPGSMTLTIGGNGRIAVAVVNAAGQPLLDKAIAFTSATPAIATVSATGDVTGVAAGGPVTITVSSEGRSATASVTVVGAPTGSAILVSTGQTFQTMTGWEALGGIGEFECNASAYQKYRTEVYDRAVDELGINRVRLPLRNGSESIVDYWTQFQTGVLPFDQWRLTWFLPTNDNADPQVANPAGFSWGFLDNTVEQVVLPLRQRLQARGEELYVNLAYTDFRNNTAFEHSTDPEEYAELVVAAFQHLQTKYGIVPQAFELLIEPNNAAWSAQQLGQAAVAAKRRLAAHGFTPAIIGPSGSSTYASYTYFDQMMLVPGMTGVLTDFSFHRYGTVTNTDLAAINARARARGLRTAMLEHIGSGYEDLHTDLTITGVSSWQQFGLAFCGGVDQGGVYFPVYGAAGSQNAPVVQTGSRSKFLRQYFRYIRLGAVRVGATSAVATLDPVAFRNVNGRYVVVVKATGAESFTIAGLPAGTYGIEYTTATAYAQSLPDVTIGLGAAVSGSIPGAGAITVYAK